MLFFLSCFPEVTHCWDMGLGGDRQASAREARKSIAQSNMKRWKLNI